MIALDNVSYLSQTNLKDLNFPATAKEIIMLGTQKHKKFPFYTSEDKENYKEIIKKLKIEDIQDKRIGDLSGGQKQRVLIARALCSTEKILFLDEPLKGLDVNASNQLFEIISHINKEYGVTIVMITHNIEIALKYISKIVYLEIGDNFVGTPKEFLESKHAKTYNSLLNLP